MSVNYKGDQGQQVLMKDAYIVIDVMHILMINLWFPKQFPVVWKQTL